MDMLISFHSALDEELELGLVIEDIANWNEDLAEQMFRILTGNDESH